jgi:23S rRNA pseudouridine1911/1915/1917 synthase
MKRKRSPQSSVEVPPEMSQWRLDRILAHILPGWSRKEVGELVVSGAVMCGREVFNKGTSKMSAGTCLDIDTSMLKRLDMLHRKRRDITSFAYTGVVSAVVPEDIPLDVVYEDTGVLIVDKPAGMVIHPAYANASGTLANALAGYFKNRGIPIIKRIGLVHRLDKDVSGLVVVAKHDNSLRSLSKQFSSEGIRHGNINLEGKAWKYYRAFVMEMTSGAILRSGLKKGRPVLVEGWVRRSVGDRRTFEFRTYSDSVRGSNKEKYAASYMTLISNRKKEWEVEVQIVTGRTHQIRVQLASLGLPIVGDKTYGKGGGYMKLRCEKVSYIDDWEDPEAMKSHMLRLHTLGEQVEIAKKRVVVEKRHQTDVKSRLGNRKGN